MQNNLSQSTIKDADILLVVTAPFFTKMPHIGVAYLSSYLNRQGFKADIYDLSLELFNNSKQDLKRFWGVECVNSFFQEQIAENILKNFAQELDEFVENLLLTKTRVIGFSVNLISIYVANKIAEKIKRKDPGRFIIFGGPGVFFEHPRDLIMPGFADVYVIGEGEAQLFNILKSYYNNSVIVSAPGILLAKDLGKIKTVPSESIRDLDQIPFPDFSGFRLGEYNQGSDYKPLPLLLSRGCIRHCTYCIDHIMWPKYRFRSPLHIMEEINYHIRKNRATSFEFIDLICNGSLEQLSGISDLIINSGLKFNWVSYAVIRKEMEPALFRKLKQAGCHTLIYGVESGSDRILEKMGKAYTAQEAAGVIRNTHQAGICTNINIIVGFPGETEEDFNQTIDFVLKNKDHIDEITNISGFTLFPAADVGVNKDKYGVTWEEGTDPMLFTDSNGLDRESRNRRVAKMVEMVSSLKLHKAIVNKPVLNPKVRQ
ncbi:MAG: radical SAM protein [Candidatus Omnitrophica bacterium]|nr:radical SAM protein [Candidatus Omnitrophota bacterium]